MQRSDSGCAAIWWRNKTLHISHHDDQEVAFLSFMGYGRVSAHQARNVRVGNQRTKTEHPTCRGSAMKHKLHLTKSATVLARCLTFNAGICLTALLVLCGRS